MRTRGTAEALARDIFDSERRSRAAARQRSFDAKLADLVALQRMANVILRASGRAERPVWPERDRRRED